MASPSCAQNDTGGRRAVLILGGSGGVGTFAVQLAKHYLRCHTVTPKPNGTVGCNVGTGCFRYVPCGRGCQRGACGVAAFSQISQRVRRCDAHWLLVRPQVATCSSRNTSLVEGLGADEVYDYNTQDFLRSIPKPALGQGKDGFQVISIAYIMMISGAPRCCHSYALCRAVVSPLIYFGLETSE